MKNVEMKTDGNILTIKVVGYWLLVNSYWLLAISHKPLPNAYYQLPITNNL